MSRWVVLWWASAFVYSAIRGWKSHDAPGRGGGRPKGWIAIHQFVFNFLGALVGCVAAYFLYVKFAGCFGGTCKKTFDLADFGLVLLAFWGLTGHLPLVSLKLQNPTP